jgi:hypothetical protein
MLIQRCDEGLEAERYSAQRRMALVELMQTNGAVISRHSSGFG